MLPREMVMRVNKMITKEKMLWSVIKFFKEMYGDQFVEFVSGYPGLKGYKRKCMGFSQGQIKLSVIMRCLY